MLDLRGGHLDHTPVAQGDKRTCGVFGTNSENGQRLDKTNDVI